MLTQSLLSLILLDAALLFEEELQALVAPTRTHFLKQAAVEAFHDVVVDSFCHVGNKLLL